MMLTGNATLDQLVKNNWPLIKQTSPNFNRKSSCNQQITIYASLNTGFSGVYIPAFHNLSYIPCRSVRRPCFSKLDLTDIKNNTLLHSSWITYITSKYSSTTTLVLRWFAFNRRKHSIQPVTTDRESRLTFVGTHVSLDVTRNLIIGWHIRTWDRSVAQVIFPLFFYTVQSVH